MPEITKDVEKALLAYRVQKLEESDEEQVRILKSMDTAVRDMYTEQVVEKQRRNIYLSVITFTITLLFNGALYVADKFTATYNEDDKKMYYDRRISESEYIKRLEKRLKELEGNDD